MAFRARKVSGAFEKRAGLNLGIPPNASLLADRAYPDQGSLSTLIRAGKCICVIIERGDAHENSIGYWRKERFKIEYVIKEVKTFKVVSQIWGHSIPLTNRVRGPYCKLRTEFFPPRFMAQARSARAINRRGKNEDP